MTGSREGRKKDRNMNTYPKNPGIAPWDQLQLELPSELVENGPQLVGNEPGQRILSILLLKYSLLAIGTEGLENERDLQGRPSLLQDIALSSDSTLLSGLGRVAPVNPSLGRVIERLTRDREEYHSVAAEVAGMQDGCYAPPGRAYFFNLGTDLPVGCGRGSVSGRPSLGVPVAVAPSAAVPSVAVLSVAVPSVGAAADSENYGQREYWDSGFDCRSSAADEERDVDIQRRPKHGHLICQEKDKLVGAGAEEGREEARATWGAHVPAGNCPRL